MTVSRFPDAPPQIAALKLDARGFPVPWFVPWIEGEPEFRAIDPRAPGFAHRHGLCWICGTPITGAARAFTIGPMCAVNRVAPEPPQHLACARFAVVSCPFLSRPMAKRRSTDDLPHQAAPGQMIERNPGVALVWLTRSYRTETQPEGGVLFRLGPPVSVEWYAEGRTASRDEVLESITTGVPLLAKMAYEQGAEAVALLERQTARAMKLVPA